MKLAGLIISAAFLMTSQSASALTFDWSFEDATDNAGLVTGTISGLVEGFNNGSGLSATVTNAASPSELGDGYVFDNTLSGSYSYGPAGFTVTDGQVTYAAALFSRNLDDYGLSSGQLLTFGENAFEAYPSLTDEPDLTWQLGAGDDTFTPEVSAAPEPSGWLLMIAGIGLTGAMLRLCGARSRQTSRGRFRPDFA